MDGDEIIRAFPRMVTQLLNKELVTVEEYGPFIGAGSTEFDDKCEGEAYSFYLDIDYDTKTMELGFPPPMTVEVLRDLIVLLERGWTIKVD